MPLPSDAHPHASPAPRPLAREREDVGAARCLRHPLALALALVVPACASSPRHAERPPGAVVHVVAFWLAPGAPQDTLERMRTFYSTRVRDEVPGVVEVLVGPPRPSDRDVVDDSFTCMSIVRFTDSAAEMGWQTHPVHDELRTQFGRYIARVVVYDFVDQP